MKKIRQYLALILLSIAPVFSFCQNYWEIIEVPDTIQIMSIAANNQNHIFLGTGGNGIKGGVYRSVDNGENWISLGYENNAIGFIELNIINQIFIPINTGIFWSNDNGYSWDTLLYYDYYVGITCFKSFDQNLFFAGLGGNTTMLIRSIDHGDNWEEVLTLPINVEYFLDIEVFNEDTVFACTTHWFDGGGVYKSVDGGDTWEFAGMYNFHCFCLEKNSIGDIFVGTYGHNTQYWLSGVYVLYHGEDEWIQLYSTLVNDMIVNSDDHLYVATDYGVLRSTDNGQTFEYINEGLFEGNVDDLAIDSSGFLYASSYDPCNMARSSVSTITGINNRNTKNNSISIFNYPNPFKGTTQIWFKLSEESSASIAIYDYTGKEVSEINPGTLKTGNHSVEFNSANLPSGIYFYSLEVNGIKTDTNKMTLVR